MGFLDTLTNMFTGAPVQQAAQQNQQLYQANQAAGTGHLNTGYNNAQTGYNQAAAAYNPLADLASQFGQGTNAYFDALGINGPQGNATAVANFQAGPGYQWQRDQALEAATRGAAARSAGGIGGNTLAALAGLGSNLANQEWGSHLTRLGGFMDPQLRATGAAAAGRGGAYTGLAGAGMTHGLNLANLGTTTTSGMANANNQSAQAQMQASQNFWNLLQNSANTAASMATGMPMPARPPQQPGYTSY